MEDEISFGTWLRKQRRALDLSRKAFANQIGCAEVTLRRIEAGTLKPSKELASIILEKLGVPEVERLQWVSFARGLSGFPSQSIPSLKKPLTNLPAPLTTFIGREKEQTDVMMLIAKHRLVTLAGSGGVGKTRLSIKVGEQIAGDYPDGVWLVELAPVIDSSLVPHTMTLALGLREDPNRRIIDLLCDYLREKRILILLDNCEHVLDACVQMIDSVLKTCPQLKILATSREPLNITGEAIYRVPSLGLPNLEQILDTFRNYESIQLFEERAQLVQFDFSLTIENAASVAHICQRLDGIPLAIELAAAKVVVFSIEKISKQLDESFNVLSGGSRTDLPHHQTLRASINWSWNLLTESEQKFMQSLSVFAGGWALEAAQSVCDGDVLYLLNSLITKSLVVMNQKTRVRYSFHETIRQYAHERLLEARGVEALRDKHLAYFVKLVEQAEPELHRANQVSWYKKLDDELDNFRRALEWALATDIKSGLRIAAIPWRFWRTRPYLQELGDWLRQLLERYSKSDSLRARSLIVYSAAFLACGNFVEARKTAEQSLQLARTLLDRQNEALSLLFLGGAFAFQGSLHEGIPLLEQSLALYRTLEDKIGQAMAMYWLAKNHNDPEYSKSLLLESLQLNRDLGNLSGIADCLSRLALREILSGDFSSPAPWLDEARTLYHDLGNQSDKAEILQFSGLLAYGQGNYQQACAYYEESLTLYEKVGVWSSSWSRFRMALAFLRQGDIVQARKAFEISLRQFQKYDSVIGLVYTIEGLASFHVNQGQLEHAGRLFTWADVMREKIGDPRPLFDQNYVERDLAVIHAKLNETEFAKLWKEGRSMTVEQAIALALEPAEEM